MPNNVIRKDIVQISVETDSSQLDKLSKKIDKTTGVISDDMTGSLNQAENAIRRIGESDGLADASKDAKDLAHNAKGAADDLDDVANTNFNKLTSGLNAINRKLTNLGGKVCSGVVKGLKTVAKVSFAGLVAGIGAAATGLVTVAKLASDLEETKNKIEVSFGVKDASGKVIDDTYSKKVMEWSKNSTTSMGLAQQTALDMTALFGDMGVSMGFTEKAAADMSMALTQQAADLASFKNMDIDSVTTALKGVYTGETESLKNLGVVMTQANLEQFAMEQGITKSYEAMTQAEKVQLRYNYLMKVTKNATGDYVRTGGGFANQLRTLTENFKQLGAVIGKLPMEKLASGMKVINDALAKIQGILSDGIQDGDIDQIVNIIEGLIDKGINALSTGLPKILPKVVEVGSTIMQALVRALPKVAPALARGLAELIVSLGQIIIDNGPELVGAVKQVIVEVLDVIGETFGEKFPLIKKLATFLSKNADTLTKIVGAILGIAVAFKVVNTVYSKVQGVMSIFGKGKGSLGGGSGTSGNGSDAANNITKPFSGFANIKIGTVLKGIANLTIILTALTGLAAIFLPLSKEIAKTGDLKSVLEVAAVMAILGVIGTAMTKAAGSLGKIPVATVAKGLASIAIIVAGLSALFLLVGALSLLDFDYKRMVVIVGMMGLLGIVGSACAVFAGIVGMIPIPVVLTGLANIALVLAGLTAVIVAFGAIAQIPGIDFFVNEGANLLIKIFDTLGKCVGAIIGGMAEQISTSLPTIGKNLASFAQNVKPMFTIFASADMSGVGAFFDALSTFLLTLAGKGILDSINKLFGGKNTLTTLGSDLTTFATKASGFFTTVATYPEAGFANATRLFDCLAGVKNLPSEGGIKGWINGAINYDSLASGLGKLGGNNVVAFFKAAAKLPAEGFNKAGQLFECLANLKSLPSEGGVKGWFNGEIAWDDISTNLPKIGDAAKSFFTSISSIKDFSLMSKLFTELKKASEILGKDGGLLDTLADLFTGDENSGMIKMGEDLAAFATSSKPFFDLVNKDTVDNITKFWDALGNPKIGSDALSTLETHLSNIVKKVEELPEKMATGLEKSGDALKDSLVSIWVEAAKAMAAPVNKIISGANWILNQFGSNKKVESWTPYAKGTNGHKGGNALVNDGRGAELVQMPNGSTFIPNGKNVFIPNAPKGMKVLPADRTAQLLGKKSPTFNYADGTGEIDIWSFIDDASGLVSAVTKKFVNYDNLAGYNLDASTAMVSTISDQMVDWTDNLFKELRNFNYDATKGVTQWLPLVSRALKIEKQYSLLNVARTLFQMQTESGGNPNAINLWDSNAKKGIPSKGLMQVIDPTFRAYARPGFDENIYDPLSNILASIRYAVSRYGSLAKAYRGKGYANGGIATTPSIFGEDGAEMAIPLTKDKRKRGVELWQQTGQMLGISSYTPEKDYGTYTEVNNTEYNTYSPHFSITISGSNSDRELARKVKRFVQEGITDCLESVSRQSPKLREV